MYCGQCGFKAENTDKFCKKCGVSLLNHEESSGRKNVNKKNHKWFIIAGVVLLLSFILAGSIVFQGQSTERKFQDAMNQGNLYLEAMDFSRAEVAFLRAIEIDPRQVEPYLELANIYIEWEEYDMALAIIELGLESVPEEEWPILMEVFNEIHEMDRLEPESLVDEVVAEEEDEESEDMDFIYLVLIAFHNFLSNPQSVVFDRFYGPDIHISWDINTIRHAELIDLRGDGIPQLIIVPPPIEGMFWAVPFMIFEYTGQQVEMIYQGLHYGEGGQWGLYYLGFTAYGRTYLVLREGAVGGISREEVMYFTLENGEFVQVLTSISYSRSEEVNGEWTQVVERSYVNGQLVSVVDFEVASYEYLEIIEVRGFIPRLDEVGGIYPLLDYIEDRLEAVGVTLEHLLNTRSFRERFGNNPLDVALNEELEEALSTFDMTVVINSFAELWQMEIDWAYQNVIQLASLNTRELFEEEYANWTRTYNDLLQERLEQLELTGGTADVINAAFVQLDFFREKAKKVFNSWYLYDSQFTFIFD